jgi:16S rRNA processing protein RimM
MSGAVAEWVWLARIRKPQGRKGEVFAEILTDFPEKFAQRRKLWLLLDAGAPSKLRLGGNETKEVELINHWQHKGGIVLHFAGIDSISAAETLAGLIVAIPRSERAALADDAVHIADLIGCALIDMSVDPPAAIGTIENVDRTAGPVPLLIVKGAKGEVLVPFAKSYLHKVDVENQRVEMALPEGLVDLNG